ncbi:MAG: DUF6305 family protein [Candidatus Ornithospirochaeta sp.]|nr:DUF6305 family protein [Sphaerochaetaceae bacterium]MDY5524399.1 DUF6305 family protein [Candidatus Ornithospirochaeta sp.]
MKKTIAIIVIIVVAISVVSAATKNTTPSTGTAQGSATYSAETAANYKYQTSSSNRMVTIGTKSVDFEAPVLVTSFGQSTDGSMIEQVMKRLKTVSYSYNPTATGADLDGVKTVVIAVGNSTKGLGAAGISQEQETARAKEFMAAVEKKGVKVILCHIGGATRRGSLSDAFADMVLPLSSYMVVKEDGNEDSKFTSYASAHSIPITLVYGSKDTVDAFRLIFD